MTFAFSFGSPQFLERKRDAKRIVRTLVDGMLVARGSPSTPAAHVLIFPPDPWEVFGSLGDDAMLRVVEEQFLTSNPRARFSFLCLGDASMAALRARGHAAVTLPSIHGFPRAFRALLEAGTFDAFVAVGADVMDGHYNTEVPRQMLMAASLAARSGISATFTGFSFNENPAPELQPYFSWLPRSVAVNVRDPVSLGRIRRFATTPAKLSADAAFLLTPEPVDAETSDWIEERRALGRRVAGFNLHPMILSEKRAPLESIFDEISIAIETASERHAVDWLLVPHDYRGAGVGDDEILRPLAERLAVRGRAAFRYFDGAHPASVLKGLAGSLDAVVTARMHLAIAALGMGTPVAGFAYQGKFTGLWQHFDLPDQLLTDATVFTRAGACTAFIDRLFADLPTLRDRVAQGRAHVVTLAAGTFTQ